MADILILLILRLRSGRPIGTSTIRSSSQAAAIKVRIEHLGARSLIHVKPRMADGAQSADV